VALAAVAALGSPLSAQDTNGFLRDKGAGDVALSYTSESYDQFWAGETKVSAPPLGEVTTESWSLWTAYGLTDDLTLVVQLPYVDAEGDGTAGLSESDLQDAAVLGLYRLADWGGRTRSQLIGGLGISTPASSYEPDLPVSVGDGTTDGLFRLVYLLQHGNLYFSQQVGFDLRSDDAPNDFPFYTELGYTIGQTTLTGFFAMLLADGGTDIGDPGFTFPSNQEEYQRIGARSSSVSPGGPVWRSPVSRPSTGATRAMRAACRSAST
jgi:hypothetical protein